MSSLQTRLLFSISGVILLTLAIITVAFIAFLRSVPVPVDSLINDLAVVSLETDFRPNRGNSYTFLDEIAAETGYRLLLLNGEDQVLYDSFAQLSGPLFLENQAPLFNRQGRRNRQTIFVHGETNLADRPWVFVGRRVAGRGESLQYLVASPRPRQSLRNVLRTFEGNFFLSLCQAGFIGLGLAFLLSLWLSRSIAKPLQQIAHAANRVAAGDYDHRLPSANFREAQMVAHAFNDMAEQVKLNQQAQHDFLANITHDLRTPLTSIQGFSQAILDEVANDPKQAAQVIYDESGRLSRLVSDLLDLAKIQAGRLQMLRQAVELDAILQRVGESLQIKAQAKQISLELEVPRLIRMGGDGDRLAQVFTNLVDNAIKHTDPGGKVTLKAKLKDEGILVQVKDTGEGIPATDVSRIFERFYQVDKSRNRRAQNQGAGLGLAITKEIIEAHGGKIWVESQVGIGSRFNVWLPLPSGDQTTIIQKRW